MQGPYYKPNPMRNAVLPPNGQPGVRHDQRRPALQLINMPGTGVVDLSMVEPTQTVLRSQTLAGVPVKTLRTTLRGEMTNLDEFLYSPVSSTGTIRVRNFH